MKEYLEPMSNGDYRYHKDEGFCVGGDWIEIPEGANIITKSSHAVVGDIFFHWKAFDSDEFWLKDEMVWLNNFGESLNDYINENNSVIIWQRKKTIASAVEHGSVNHPKHYVSDPCGVEAIEITSLLPACLSNATKYIWREGKKDSSLQELEKALWYINYSIDNNLPSSVNDLTDSMHFEELITKVKKHWNGWKYVFIDAVYWGDQQQMKRAIEGMITDIKGVQ